MCETAILQAPTCAGGLNPNCAESCAVFTDPAKRAAFGYEAESAACECHDICVEDVRDIAAKDRTLFQCVPCNVDGRAGCRGGFLPDGVPVVQSWRVMCAEESLSPSTGCDRINNEIEFEVVLRYGGTLVVVTPRDNFSIMWHEFAKFPSGTFYPNTYEGKNQFRSELTLIDGSCKVIIVESVSVATEGNDCVLQIEYKVIDKLWKHENLLVSAIKPYPAVGNTENITVSQEFNAGHSVGACLGESRCTGQ